MFEIAESMLLQLINLIPELIALYLIFYFIGGLIFND